MNVHRDAVRFAIAASFAVLAAAEPARATQETDRLAAVVGREAITMSEVRRSAQIVAGATGQGTDITDAMLGRELDTLIEREILRQHMRKVGISVADAEVEAALGEMVGRAGLRPEQVDQMLEHQGLSKDEYRDRIRGELERRRVVDIEVRPRVVVEDAEIQRYYEKNSGDVTVPASVHIRDIYLPYPPQSDAEQRALVVSEAREILATAKSGEVSFEELARRHSKGPGAEDGGDLGIFEKGKLRSELEEAAFALEPGGVGGPVESGGGVHLIQLVERVSGGAQPLDDVKGQIREKLLQSALERTYKRWYERLLAEAHVERRVQLPSAFDSPAAPAKPEPAEAPTEVVPEAPRTEVTPTEPATPADPDPAEGAGAAPAAPVREAPETEAPATP